MSLVANKKYRANFQKNEVAPDAHSAWIVEFKDGYLNNSEQYACYFPIFHTRTGTPIKKLIIFFGSCYWKQRPWLVDWCKFITEDSFLAPCFVNKSVEDGIKCGFEMNLDEDAMLVRGAMMQLRWAFEHKGFAWDSLREMGFDEVEAWALAQNYIINPEGKDIFTHEITPESVGYNEFNTNHSIIERFVKFPAYLGEGFKPYGNPAKENYWGYGVHDYFGSGVGSYQDLWGFSEIEQEKTLKETFDKLLKKMKG